MCFKMKVPKIPDVRPAPTRTDVQSTVGDERKRLAESRGVLDNIFTSSLGDTGYGANAQKLARLGAAA